MTLCKQKNSLVYHQNTELKPIIDTSLQILLMPDFGDSISWNDLSINNRNGINYGGTRTLTHASGIFGSHYYFDELLPYIDLGGAIIGNSTTFTISVWYKTTTPTFGDSSPVIYSEGNILNAKPLINISVNDPNIGDCKFGIRDDNGIVGSVGITGCNSNDGLWHNLVGVQTSKSSRLLYKDGVLVSTNNIILGNVTTTNATIATRKRATFGRYYSGDVGLVTLYNRELLSSEVMYNYIHSPFYYIRNSI